MSFDVFISYSTKDAITAKATCAALEAAKIRCWIAPRDIVPGAKWGASIVRAINQCRMMVLIFSGNANDSTQVQREVDQAFNRGKAVLPLRIEDVKPADELAYYLDTVHWLDALTPPLERNWKSSSSPCKRCCRRLMTRFQAASQPPKSLFWRRRKTRRAPRTSGASNRLRPASAPRTRLNAHRKPPRRDEKANGPKRNASPNNTGPKRKKKNGMRRNGSAENKK